MAAGIMVEMRAPAITALIRLATEKRSRQPLAATLAANMYQSEAMRPDAAVVAMGKTTAPKRYWTRLGAWFLLKMPPAKTIAAMKLPTPAKTKTRATSQRAGQVENSATPEMIRSKEGMVVVACCSARSGRLRVQTKVAQLPQVEVSAAATPRYMDKRQGLQWSSSWPTKYKVPRGRIRQTAFATSQRIHSPKNPATFLGVLIIIDL